MECMRHGPSEKRNKKQNYVMKTDMEGGVALREWFNPQYR